MTRAAAVSGAWTLALLLYTAGHASASAAAEDYLSAITAEGERLETLGKARQELERVRQRSERRDPPAAATSPTATHSPAAANSTTAAARAQFEQSLREEFPYSYALYLLLTEKEKDEVYGEFRSGQGEGAARFLPVLKKIVALSSSKHDKR